MNGLIDNNRIVCVQEADGVEQTLVRVATERGLTKCNSFQGMMTFWDPNEFALVKYCEMRIWPKDSGQKFEWRRLVVCILRSTSVESPCFAVCNNHCHDGEKPTQFATIPNISNLNI